MQDAHHYYATSAAEWKVADDLRDLINWMERSPYPYTVYFVPLDIDADYEIRYYTPQVEGLFCIGNFEPRKASKAA